MLLILLILLVISFFCLNSIPMYALLLPTLSMFNLWVKVKGDELTIKQEEVEVENQYQVKVLMMRFSR